MLFTLGAYDVEEELGRGAFGRVYRATHRPTGAARALKVIEGVADPEALLRFEREVETLARVGGEGVVPVHEAGSDRGRPYLVLGLMSGGSLRQRLKRVGRLEWREAVALVAKLARALERCHAAGVIHRDLKPDNVLFDDEGRPRLADFGVVRDLQAASLTESGTAVGSPAYMAPEQLDGGKADARGDVYSLGVVLHELVTGSRPFRATGVVSLLKEKRGKRPALGVSGVPAGLDALLDRALAPRPEERTASAGELALALEGLLAKPGGVARAGSRLGLVAGLGLGLAVVGVAATLATRTGDGAARSPTPRPSGAPTALDAAALRELLARVASRRLEAGDLELLAAAPHGLASLDELAASAAVLPLRLVLAGKTTWSTKGGGADLRTLEAVTELVSHSNPGDWDKAFAQLHENPGAPGSVVRALLAAGDAAVELARSWRAAARERSRSEIASNALAALDALGNRSELIGASLAPLAGVCRENLVLRLAGGRGSGPSFEFAFRRECFDDAEVFEALPDEVAISLATYRRERNDGPQIREPRRVFDSLRKRSPELERRHDAVLAAQALWFTLRDASSSAEQSERDLGAIQRILGALPPGGSDETDESPAAREISRRAIVDHEGKCGTWAVTCVTTLRARDQIDAALARWRRAIRLVIEWPDTRSDGRKREIKRGLFADRLALVGLALPGDGVKDGLAEHEPVRRVVAALQSHDATAATEAAKALQSARTGEGHDYDESSTVLNEIGNGVLEGLDAGTEAELDARHERHPERGSPSWIAALATVRQLGRH